MSKFIFFLVLNFIIGMITMHLFGWAGVVIYVFAYTIATLGARLST